MESEQLEKSDEVAIVVRAWLDFFQRVELYDRTIRHNKALHSRAGVRPVNNSANARHSVVGRLANVLSERVEPASSKAVELARGIAIGIHESWLSANPCECDACAPPL
jgi:hypothetical protein